MPSTVLSTSIHHYHSVFIQKLLEVIIIVLIFRWRSLNLETSGNLAKVTQLFCGTGTVWTQKSACKAITPYSLFILIPWEKESFTRGTLMGFGFLNLPSNLSNLCIVFWSSNIMKSGQLIKTLTSIVLVQIPTLLLVTMWLWTSCSCSSNLIFSFCEYGYLFKLCLKMIKHLKSLF